MNAKVVVSSSEIVLRRLLEGQPSDLVEELTRDLRIRKTFQWAGPDASLAPLTVRRKVPGGGETIETIRDLIAAEKLRWDADELAFVTQPGDLAEYTISGDDEGLAEILNHPSVPETVRDGLREHLDLTGPSPDACRRILATMRTQLESIVPLRATRGAFVLRQEDRQQPFHLAAKEALCGDLTVTTFLRAADGREVLRVDHRRGEELCTVELVPPLPEGFDPSRVVLAVGDRRVDPVIPFNKYGYGRVRYDDVEGALARGTPFYIKLE